MPARRPLIACESDEGTEKADVLLNETVNLRGVMLLCIGDASRRSGLHW